MSNHRRPDSFTHNQPETGAVATHHELRPITHDGMNDKIASPLPASAADCFGEVRAAT